MRIDKFLHSVRYFKTRSIASEACKKNKVWINNEFTKASREVLVGDQVKIRKGAFLFQLKVVGIPNNRVGAKNIGLYIVDETPKQDLEEIAQRQKDQSTYRAKGEGRPTKKDRRSLDDFISKSKENP